MIFAFNTFPFQIIFPPFLYNRWQFWSYFIILLHRNNGIYLMTTSKIDLFSSINPIERWWHISFEIAYCQCVHIITFLYFPEIPLSKLGTLFESTKLMTHYFKVSVLGCLVLDSRFCRSYGALWIIRGIEQGLRFASPPAYVLITPMALYYPVKF